MGSPQTWREFEATLTTEELEVFYSQFQEESVLLPNPDPTDGRRFKEIYPIVQSLVDKGMLVHKGSVKDHEDRPAYWNLGHAYYWAGQAMLPQNRPSSSGTQAQAEEAQAIYDAYGTF